MCHLKRSKKQRRVASSVYFIHLLYMMPSLSLYPGNKVFNGPLQPRHPAARLHLPQPPRVLEAEGRLRCFLPELHLDVEIEPGRFYYYYCYDVILIGSAAGIAMP